MTKLTKTAEKAGEIMRRNYGILSCPWGCKGSLPVSDKTVNRDRCGTADLNKATTHHDVLGISITVGPKTTEHT